MSGNNMENLLLGDDSSSGDESDSDQAKKPPVAAAPAPPIVQQRSVQVPPQQQQPAMQRPPQQPQPQHPQQQMRPPQAMQHQHQQARQPPQQQQSQKPSEMTMRLSQMYAPASANASNNNNQAISSNMAGSAFSSTHPGMQQQQASSQQHRPVAARGGIPHQAVISVTSTPAQGSQSNRGPPNMQAGSSKDQYAPTPVSQIIERSKHKQQQQQQQGRRPQQPPYAYGNGSNNTSATSSSSAATLSTSNVHAGPAAASNTGAGGASGLPLSSSSSAAPPPAGTAERIAFDREMKKQKEKFIMFTRVLMKYLETKDPTLHQTVKTIIKDCAERNKRQERGYESVTASMKHRLRQVVGDQYWKRAEAYLNHFLKEKEKKADGSGGSSSNSSSRGPNGQGPSGQGPSGGGMMPPQQQQMMNPNGSGSQQQPHLIPPSSSSRPNSSQAPPSMAAMRQDMEQRKMALAAAGNSSTAKQQQQGVNKYPPTSSGGPKSSSNVPHQQASQPFAFNKSKPAGGATAKSPIPAASSMNNQSRKIAGSPGIKKAAASTTNPLPTTETQQSSAPREYNEFMQMVDNAVNFDWTTAGLMTGERLMFAPPQWMSDELQPSPVKTTNALAASDIGASFIVPGWAHSNVVSSRTAWARVRLPELTRRDGPVLPGLSALPAMTAVTSLETNSWYNEDVAEDDAVLAAISEGCQIYLKQILEKAIYCSRQRQNLDGIRLYYNQCTKKEPQPLSLRLGCDVRRQWARTSGNAALVCKRMEEALERQENVPHSARVLNQETLCHVESMSTLALRPKLANGAEDADREAKRCFEVYGGKDAREVFGRVPKQPKLELIDFQLD